MGNCWPGCTPEIDEFGYQGIDDNSQSNTGVLPQIVISEDRDSGPRNESSQPQEQEGKTCFVLSVSNDKFQQAVNEFLQITNRRLPQGSGRCRMIAIAPGQSSLGEDTTDAFRPVLVPCLAASRVASCLESALNSVALPASSRRLVVVFHPRAPHDTRVPSSLSNLGSTKKSEFHLLVDVVFDRSTGGLFQTDLNEASAAKLAEYLADGHH